MFYSKPLPYVIVGHHPTDPRPISIRSGSIEAARHNLRAFEVERRGHGIPRPRVWLEGLTRADLVTLDDVAL